MSLERDILLDLPGLLKRAVVYYHGSPRADLQELNAGSYVTPDYEIARLMGRHHLDTGKTWSDEDLEEKHKLGGDPKWKAGREPLGEPTIYSADLPDTALDFLDNPYEHTVRAKTTVKPPADVYIIRGNPDVDTEHAAEYDAFYDAIKKNVEARGLTAEFDPGLAYTSPPGGKYWIGHSRGVSRLDYAPEHVQTLALDDYEPAEARQLQEEQYQKLFKELGHTDVASIPVDQRPQPGPEHYTFNDDMRTALDNMFLSKQALDRDILLDLPGLLKQAALKPDVVLQPHQERIVDAAGSGTRKLLYHTLGSGKTLSAIAAAEAMGKSYGAVVPAALRPNLKKEREKFTDEELEEDTQSYTMLGRGRHPLHSNTVIMDEAHRLRNEKSKQTIEAKRLAESADQLYLLSGSPIVNAPHDLAPLMEMLTQQPITTDEFDRTYLKSETVKPSIMGSLKGVKPGIRYGLKNKKKLQEALGGKVDYYKPEDPAVEREEERIVVDMSPEQEYLHQKFYKRLPKPLRYKLEKNFPLSKTEQKNFLAFLGGPRQVALSTAPWQSDEDRATSGLTQTPKIQRALEELEAQIETDPETRAVIFSNFINAGLDPYAAALEAKKIPHGVFHGGLNDKQRAEVVDKYNKGDLRALLLGPAASEGISLKGTKLIQLLDPHWNEARLNQAIGRGIRFDSHEHLPEEERKVKIQRFLSQLPEKKRSILLRWLPRLSNPSRDTADQVLENYAREKQRVNDLFLQQLQEIGTEKGAADHAILLDLPGLLKQAIEPRQSRTEFLQKLIADPDRKDAIWNIEGTLHGEGPRTAMFAPLSEQGTVTPTYKATTPWPERLYRQRHGTREFAKRVPPQYEDQRSSSARRFQGGLAWARPGTGVAYVPKRVQRTRQPGLSTEFSDVLNYWATKNHEAEHTFNQSPMAEGIEAFDRQRMTREVGPSIADLIFRGEQFAKEEGKPLRHTVKLPGGVKHDINWMMQQAKEHGYWGKDGQPPRSMDSLIFDTTAGQQWYKRMVQGATIDKTNRRHPWPSDETALLPQHQPPTKFTEGFKEQVLDSNSAVREFMNRLKTPESTHPVPPPHAVEHQKQGSAYLQGATVAPRGNATLRALTANTALDPYTEHYSSPGEYLNELIPGALMSRPSEGPLFPSGQSPWQSVQSVLNRPLRRRQLANQHARSFRMIQAAIAKLEAQRGRNQAWAQQTMNQPVTAVDSPWGSQQIQSGTMPNFRAGHSQIAGGGGEGDAFDRRTGFFYDAMRGSPDQFSLKSSTGNESTWLHKPTGMRYTVPDAPSPSNQFAVMAEQPNFNEWANSMRWRQGQPARNA